MSEESKLSQFLDKLTRIRKKMNIKLFGHNYQSSENAKTAFMLMSLLLLVVVILQQVKINSQHERLVIVPPQMTKEAKIAWDSSNANYVSDFSLYLATQISSHTPKNVDYIIGAMEGYFHPQIWQTLKPQLLAVKDNPNYFGLSNPVSQFTPTGGVIFEPETEKTFVSGELRTSAYGKQGGLDTLGTLNITYEMKLAIQNGLPKVMEWYVYDGQPLTQEFRAKRPAEYDKKMAERQVSPLPMVTDSQIQRESKQNTITMTLDRPQQPVQQPVQQQQPQVEMMQPSALPNSQQEQTTPQAVQAAPTQQQVLDPFAAAEQSANQATNQQQAVGQAQQPAAAPAVVLPNGQTQGLPQPPVNPAMNTMPPSFDDDRL